MAIGQRFAPGTSPRLLWVKRNGRIFVAEKNPGFTIDFQGFTFCIFCVSMINLLMQAMLRLVHHYDWLQHVLQYMIIYAVERLEILKYIECLPAGKPLFHSSNSLLRAVQSAENVLAVLVARRHFNVEQKERQGRTVKLVPRVALKVCGSSNDPACDS